MRRIVVGITGASGIIYGVKILEELRRSSEIESHLIMSKPAIQTLKYESDLSASELNALGDVTYSNQDIGAAIASGSFKTDGMIVAPCSVHTLSKISHCISDNLICRAADVMLKERKKLLLLFRETPLHSGHLENMLKVNQMGAILCPPVPAFYHRPKSIDELVNHTIGRLLDLLDISHQLTKEWTGEI